MPPLHNALESCRRAATGAAMGLALLAATDAALASAQRTFVASAGNDANPCSIVAPCHSFAAALAQTNSGGEIVALDSAGYAPVDIFGSVSIIAPAGVYAGITAFSGWAIRIGGSNLRVLLRGLTINALGGTDGVFVQAARPTSASRASRSADFRMPRSA